MLSAPGAARGCIIGKKKTTTKVNQTTTPSVTEPYNTAFSDYTGMIGDFLDMDPTQFVAPESELQTQAFGQAQNLGGWEPYLQQSSNLANQAANAPASSVTPYGYNAPDMSGAWTISGAQLDPASTYGGAQLGPASQMSATGYQAPTINGVAGPQAHAAQQTTLGGAPTVNLGGYNLPGLGGAAQVGSFGYNAPQLGDAALASHEGLLNDPSRIRDFMADYQNPYTSQVIDASLAKFDEDAGRREAALSAQGAIGGAFGGSRYGIAEGTLEGSLARERADLQARLYDEQYKTAAGLAGSDASAFNQFALTNAGMGLQTALSNQNAQNQYGLEQAGLAERAGQYNASNAFQSALSNQNANNQFALTEYGAGIDQARYGADAANQGQLANQNMLAQYAMTQFGADTQSAQQFASALNNASLAGYQGDLQTALTQAGFDADSARYYADAMNQAGFANMDALNQFASQQAGMDQQTGLANMDATNQFALQQGMLDQQTDITNQDALNQFLMTQYGMNADEARYYADSQNQASYANANLLEQSYLRDLQAAGQLGDLSQQYGTQSLADLGMTADLGTLQRSLEAEYLNAYPTQLQMAGSLYGQLSPALYSGNTTIGTNKTTQSGGLLGGLLGAGLTAAATTYGGPGWTFSDSRLKSNIAKVGEFKDGLGVYDYDIFGTRQRGVMADEVAELRPWALGPVVNGFATVDYGKIEGDY